METLVQRCVRIAGALEDLVGQEAAALESHDYAGVLVLQERAEPLVAFLSQHAPVHAGDSALRARITAVQELRTRSALRIANDIVRAKADLDESRLAQRQVARIAPAYGRGQASRMQLSIVG
jgi:hypothetical protein